MNKNAKIFVAGHRGLVGSGIVRALEKQGYSNIICRTRKELDLTRQAEVEAFFDTERPDYVFLSAAKVGGIQANNIYPADFIQENLLIQTHVIEAAYQAQVKRLLFLGSSCIYPKFCPQPMKEEYLLTGPLEPTNRPYAIAKIAGIEQCWAYNRQYGTQYLAVMPTNLYGPNDNYDLQNSHVLPALIRKVHEARINNEPSITAWGTGSPRREFLYVDDMAEACVFLMNLDEASYKALLESKDQPPLINVGCGKDVSIKELLEVVKKVLGYQGEVKWDASKPDGTMQKLLDIGKIKALGWQPKVGLAEGIAIAYEQFKNGQAI
ncbi:MAG: GDP-fucose synthetase [Gammaproteobacteria bacterium]|jgi:GDP-L-fucose synthase|nr:GDP-fucose synthetase [Gammaproteobacteria bacterium]